MNDTTKDIIIIVVAAIFFFITFTVFAWGILLSLDINLWNLDSNSFTIAFGIIFGLTFVCTLPFIIRAID